MMAKEPKAENDKEQETDTTAHAAFDENDVIQTVEVNDVKEMVVKKSSSVFSLLVAIIALAGVVYLFYKDWQGNGRTNDTAVSASELQQLKDSDQVLNTDIQSNQVDIKALQQQTAEINVLKKQVNDLTQQLLVLDENKGTVGVAEPFDNSANENAMDRLAQQLNQQTQAIQALQSQPKTMNSDNTSAEVLAANNNQIEKNVAIQVLLNTEVLLATQRLDVAKSSLDSYLKISGLNAVDKNKILEVLQQLQQVATVDTDWLEQQLSALSSEVQALALTTEVTTETGSRWYERFVSVKKIAEDNNITSTAQLVALKTALNRWLYQAKLYLILNDQNGWRNSLDQASALIKDELPENNELQAAVSSLANKKVVAELPRQLNIGAVIDQLKGSR